MILTEMVASQIESLKATARQQRQDAEAYRAKAVEADAFATELEKQAEQWETASREVDG